MKPGPDCIKLVQEFEGYARDLGDGRVQAYPDPATGGAPFTIGFGTTGPDVKKGTIWTRKQAEDRFTAHLAEFAAKVGKLIGNAPTTQHEFDAIVSLSYNVGVANVAKSTLLKKHKARDYMGAANEFLRWNRAAGKVMAGLTRRRTAERALYLKSDG
jgi:lysozyme